MCSNCVLTSATPGITFDQSGICSYCSTYTPMKVEGEEKLVATLKRFKNRGERYDCMVCVSGGRDSTYALWRCVHDWGMKVLAVNYRNPFTSEQARKNMRQAVEKLNVDFYDWEFPNDVHRRATAKALRA